MVGGEGHGDSSPPPPLQKQGGLSSLLLPNAHTIIYCTIMNDVNYLYISAQEKIAIKAAPKWLSKFFRNSLRENFLKGHAPRLP